MEPQAECMLVVIGATPEGKKELLGFPVGVRESAQSWRELLVELKARGLTIAPELATGDGALGFWKALEEVFPTTRHQRCTVHKTANVLDKLPTSGAAGRQTRLAPDLDWRRIARRRTRRRRCRREYAAKYERDGRLPGEGSQRAADMSKTSPPSTGTICERRTRSRAWFATVRHRTVCTRAALSQDTARLLLFKLIMAAAKTWRRLKGENQLPKVVAGITFRNGLEVTDTPKQSAA